MGRPAAMHSLALLASLVVAALLLACAPASAYFPLRDRNLLSDGVKPNKVAVMQDTDGGSFTTTSKKAKASAPRLNYYGGPVLSNIKVFTIM